MARKSIQTHHAPDHPTADEVYNLLSLLTPTEAIRFWHHIYTDPASAPVKRMEALRQRLRQTQEELQIAKAGQAIFGSAWSQYLASLAKPRKTDRDDEIVRLRDVVGRTFGEIGLDLPDLNSAWVGKDGKPLGRYAVKRAYDRHKKERQKETDLAASKYLEQLVNRGEVIEDWSFGESGRKLNLRQKIRQTQNKT
jgi:hypothetical protein